MIIYTLLFSFAIEARTQTWVSPPDASEDEVETLEAAGDAAPLEPLPPEPEASPQPSGPVLPVYLALKPNLNDFVGFSDGGWDGNWYVGYNSCWIVKVPAPPPGDYQKAFLGAKLGRAKTRTKSESGFEQEPIPGKIYMGIASTPSFGSERRFFLSRAEDLPSQPDPTLISGWVGQPGWVWTEIPVSAVDLKGPNYLAIWSNTDAFISVASAPVLAAATVERPLPAWLNRSIRGAPPSDPANALETQISRLVPALALKLVPKNDGKVSVVGAVVETVDGERVVRFSVDGGAVDSAWYEVSYDMLSWMRNGPRLLHPPLSFTLEPSLLAARELWVRVGAMDVLGNTGYSKPLKVGGTGRSVP